MPAKTTAALFWSRVVQSGECLIWPRTRSDGYAVTSWNGRKEYVHRIAYEWKPEEIE